MLDRKETLKRIEISIADWPYLAQCPEYTLEMLKSAQELLKVQEPQVLSVEAVRKLTRIPVWLDVKSTHKDLYRGWVLAYMVQKGMGITGERLGMTDPSGRMHWYKLDDYGRTWRVWDSIPTDTEKEAIPW